jgi:hypothetical protein
MLAGQVVNDGKALSRTVTVNVHGADTLLDASFTVAVIVVVPRLKLSPFRLVNGPPVVAPLNVNVYGETASRQLSNVVGFQLLVLLLCTYTQPALLADTVLFDWHTIVGTVLSVTTTLNEHVAELPAASVAR